MIKVCSCNFTTPQNFNAPVEHASYYVTWYLSLFSVDRYHELPVNSSEDTKDLDKLVRKSLY